jgi:tetratricopeptide (TPR) repeat protein
MDRLSGTFAAIYNHGHRGKDFRRRPDESQRSSNLATGGLGFWRHLFAITLLVAAKAVHATSPEDVATLLKTATTLQQHGDYAQCIPILKRILEISPRNYAANLWLGEDLLASGRVKDALAPLQVASGSGSEDGTAQVYLSEAAARLGDFAMAAEVLGSVRGRLGETEQFLVAWARFSLNRFRAWGVSLRDIKGGKGTELRFEAAGRPEGSEDRESLLQESVTADPGQRGIWGELGLAQLETNRVSQAKTSLVEAQRRDPQGAETLRLEALFASIEGRWSDAERSLSALGARSPVELKRALAYWPGSLLPGPAVNAPLWDCLRNRAVSCPLTSAPPRGGEGESARDLYAEGRWEQLVALPLALSADHGKSLWRGVAFAKTGDCPRAIPLLESGSNEDPRAAGFWLKVCYAGEIEQAAGRLKTMQDQEAIHELNGDVMLRLHGDAKAAQQQYTEALKSHPKDPHLLAKLADADLRLGDVAQTKAAAQSALAVDPHESSALHTLAETAISERDYAEALVRLKQLTVISPRDNWTQVQLGVAYGQLGHPDEALHYLGPELSAGYPDPKGALHAMLASALRKVGRDVEAKKAATEAARLASLSLESGGQESGDGPQ